MLRFSAIQRFSVRTFHATVSKMKLIAISLALGVFSASACDVFAQNVVGENSNGKSLSTIVLDPGHGGKDPGAIGSKYKEKAIVLEVAKRVGALLRDSLPDVKVVFTRDSDVFIPLDQRAKIAAANSADIFISIHANSSKNRQVAGSETFLLGQHRSKENLEVAQKENSVVTLEDDYTTKYEGFDPAQPESIITFAGLQSDYINKSIDMAVSIQKGFSNLGRVDRGVKQAGFLVLRQVAMPSVLIELGFISNPEEENYMASSSGAAELATSIYRSIKSFKSSFDGRKVVMKHSVDEATSAPSAPVDLWPAGVNFRVQVAAARSAANVDTAGLSPLSHIEEDGIVKYMVGICKSFEDAQKLQDDLKSRYTGCFIVAFEGRDKISVRSARKKIK